MNLIISVASGRRAVWSARVVQKISTRSHKFFNVFKINVGILFR